MLDWDEYRQMVCLSLHAKCNKLEYSIVENFVSVVKKVKVDSLCPQLWFGYFIQLTKPPYNIYHHQKYCTVLYINQVKIIFDTQIMKLLALLKSILLSVPQFCKMRKVYLLNRTTVIKK